MRRVEAAKCSQQFKHQVFCKLKQSKLELEKIVDYHKEQMDNVRTGKTYGYGVALSKKMQNLPLLLATPKELQRNCCGRPITIQIIALSWVTHLQQMRSVVWSITRKERSVILATLKSIQIEEELALQNDGMSMYSKRRT